MAMKRDTVLAPPPSVSHSAAEPSLSRQDEANTLLGLVPPTEEEGRRRLAWPPCACTILGSLAKGSGQGTQRATGTPRSREEGSGGCCVVTVGNH